MTSASKNPSGKKGGSFYFNSKFNSYKGKPGYDAQGKRKGITPKRKPSK